MQDNYSSYLERFVMTLTDIRTTLNNILLTQGDKAEGSISEFPSYIDSIFSTLDVTFKKIGYTEGNGDVYIPSFIDDGINHAKELIYGDEEKGIEPVIPNGEITDDNYMVLANDTNIRFLPKLEITGTTAKGLLQGCSNLMCIADINVSDSVESCESMFQGCKRIERIDGLHMSEKNNVASVKNMFYGCSSLINIPNNIVRGRCEYMDGIFHLCTSLGRSGEEIVNTLDWDTKSLKSFNLGAQYATRLKIDTRNWDFGGCTIQHDYAKWQYILSLVGDATPEEVDTNVITALKGFEGSIDMSMSGNNLGAVVLNQASLMALINGAANLNDTEEARTWRFFNVERLGDYKETYLNKLAEKGWTILQ